MNKSNVLFCAVGLVGTLFLAGCAPTVSVMPLKANTYSAFVTFSSESQANDAAVKKATEVCMQQGKRVQVITHDSHYQGADKSQKALFGTLQSVASVFGKRESSNGASEGSQDDYKVEMKFQCVE